jgi:hypothetical protein
VNRFATVLFLGALTCGAGCGSTNRPGGEAPVDGGGDAGPSDRLDGGGSRDGGMTRDGGASDAGDSGTETDAATSSDGGSAQPLALPTGISSSSAASYGTTESYRLYLSAGAPQPYGDGRSSNYSLRLGVRPPQ